jgi:predicted SAM-dependent methyltransferase
VHPAVRSVVRPVVLAVNTPLAKSRLTRTLRDAPRPVKLEIGGLTPRPGWVITNVNAVTKHYLDATSRWPLEDASCSHVYADNVIEHLPLAAGRAMLAEAYRCLRPGGRIRLVTPDLRRHVDLYLEGRAALTSSLAQAYRDLPWDLTVEHPVDLVRIPIASFEHYLGYLYDFDALDAELTRAGFSGTARYEIGQSDDPELRGLDQRTDEGPGQIAVEAVR